MNVGRRLRTGTFEPVRAATGRRRNLTLLIAAAAAVVAAACTSTPKFDRDGAVERMLAENPGIERSQAECYVDRVLQDLGSGLLEPGAQPKPEQVPRITSIRVDCVGVTNLGTTPPTAAVPTTEPRPGVSRPQKVGDDPQLDQMAASCRAGSGPSCDRLFDLAPLGSEYESIALTCGGRTSEKRCSEAYPDPNLPTTVAPTTVAVPGAATSP